MKLVDGIYNLMKHSAVDAGRVIMKYRGKVTNNVKMEEDSMRDEYIADGMAKTVVDEIVQELFLAELMKIAPGVRVNAEEDTPLLHLFEGNTSDMTVHQDPCDGTNSYVQGYDEFAAGYGISDGENRFTHTVIFAPVRNEIYVASPDEVRILNNRLRDVEHNHQPNHKRVYSKRLLSDKGKDAMIKAGFILETNRCSHLAICDVATGDAGAFLYMHSKPHDSFIPYAFAKGMGSKLFDAEGNVLNGTQLNVTEEIGLPKFERSKSIFYTAPDNPHTDTILDILSDRQNLNPKY